MEMKFQELWDWKNARVASEQNQSHLPGSNPDLCGRGWCVKCPLDARVFRTLEFRDEFFHEKGGIWNDMERRLQEDAGACLET